MYKNEGFLKQDLRLNNDWPTVLENNLEPKDLIVFLQRKSAVVSYLNSDLTIDEICLEYNLQKSNFYRLIRRCIEIHPDGRVYGYRALIPYSRIKKTKLKSFEKLLYDYPELKESLINDYLNKKKPGELRQHNMTKKTIHERFVQNCIKLGIGLNEYPLNTKSKAKKSVERFLNSLVDTHLQSSVSRFGDDASMKAKNTGNVTTENELNKILRPLERVEFDGHKIDASIAIIYTTPEGDEIIDTINRIWILSIIDIATRCILGYHLSLNKEYSSDDVLMCIRNAIKPWKPMNFSIPDLNYSEGSGMPSYVIPEMQYAIWDEFSYDNAKANLAIIVKDNLRSFVGCSINVGPVATPVRRPFIERFFNTLETYGFHRLVSTTGSNSQDPRRMKNSESIAVDYEITTQHIHEITDVLIANYNSTPHSGLSGLTPLQVLQQRIDKGMLIETLPDNKKDEFLFFTKKVVRTVKGDISKGVRPYIYFEGTKYINDILVNTYSLCGKKLTLLVNVDDLRFVKAFLEDGSELGILTVVGKWGYSPHSLRDRKAINKLKNNGEVSITPQDNPIEVYHKYLMANAKNKTNRNKLASFEKNQISKKERYKYGIENKTKTSDEQINTGNKSTLKKKDKDFNKLRRTIQF